MQPSSLEQRVAVLEAVVAQLQLEMQRRPRQRLPEGELFDADELGLDPEEDEEYY